jgi:HK97 family phage major capsid protein
MPSQATVHDLEVRRQTCQQRAEAICARAKADGRAELTPEEDAEVGQHIATLRTLNERLQDEREDLRRMGDPATWPGAAGRDRAPQPGTGRFGAPHTSRRYGVPNTGGTLAPLHFDHDEMRRLQAAAQRGEPCRLESRAFSTADSLLPAQLWPYPVAAIHENRLLDRLPGVSFDAPSISFIRHVSTTGAAAPTAEGGLKPELVFVTDALTEPAIKIAGNVGVSYEIVSDFESFQQYCGAELFRRVIDVENQQLLSGTGAGNITGFYSTSGILTHDCSTDTGTGVTAWDSLLVAIAALRTGPALAVADLLVLHPTDWQKIRQIKDGMNRFLVANDPSVDDVNSAWGIPVLETIWNPVGKGLLIDLTKFGYCGIREPLAMRIGYSNDDLTRNILRFVGEERLTLCVTRPSAVLALSNLP